MSLDELVQAWLDGRISEEQMRELEFRLQTQPEARKRYREMVQFDATVREWSSVRSEAGAASWQNQPAPVAPAPRASSRVWILAAAALLALLGAGAAVLWQGGAGSEVVRQRQEESSTGVAVLTRVWDAEFDGGAPRVGDTLNATSYRLKRGLAQIEFFSGATLLVEGDAELALHSAWEASCSKGKVRVRVPPPARGFKLMAPGLNLVDLGTEFGLNVEGASGHADVHVFEGEVEAHPVKDGVRLLKGGDSARYAAGSFSEVAKVNPEVFTSIEQMDQRSTARLKQRHDEWWQWTLKTREDPRLLAYYLFKHWQADRWDRLINNFTVPKTSLFAGGAVGAHWTQGRWPMKDALEFKGPGDRVRINLGEAQYQAVTFLAWVRVDGIDRKYNALLLTDGYDAGEPHWQIYEDGALMFSLAYPDPARPETSNARRNQILFTARFHARQSTALASYRGHL